MGVFAQQLLMKVYSEPSQISETELFVEIINGEKPLTTSAQSSILDVWLGSEYAVYTS